MVETIGTTRRTSRRFLRSGRGLAISLFALGVLLLADPAVAQRAAPSQDPSAPVSYGATWSHGTRPAFFHPTVWQMSPAVLVPPAATGVVPVRHSVPTEPVDPVPSGIIRISSQEKTGETASGDRPTLFGNPEVFRLESEHRLRERAQAEAKAAGKQPLPFPKDPTSPPVARLGPSHRPTIARIEPAYLFYERLMFEEKNSERYGWDLGPIGALVSPTDFYWRVLTAPLARLSAPCRSFETNAGYCLPGDPVPYLIHLPGTTGNR